MLKEILVCLEASPSSTRAIEVGLELARAHGATLSGLAIVDEPDIRAGAATGFGGSSYKHERDEALVADAHAHAQGWLDAFSARCRDGGVPARTLELRGRPAATILEELSRHDLTLLGRDANFRFETEDRDRATRDTILRRAGKPVLLVPETIVPSGPSVMACWDGSAAARRALQAFAESGLLGRRTLEMVTIGDDGEAAWELARQGCVIVGERGLRARPHHVVSPRSTIDAILDERAHLDAGMMVCGAYVPARLLRLFWGSVTRELVERTPVPLFLHY